MLTLEVALVAISLLLILSIFSSQASGKFGIPALLIFLGIGMLAGSEGVGGIYYDDPHTAQFIGIIALSYILFAGGLTTDVGMVKEVKWPGLCLSILGVLITAAMVGCFAYFFFGLNLEEGLILGGIVSATDAAAVFSVLSMKRSLLKGKLRPLLEFESGSNDPMSVFLTVGLIQLIQSPSMSKWELIPMFAQQMALGVLLGLLIGKALAVTMNRIHLEHAGLYPILIFSSVLLIYGLTSLLGGSGFLAVYLAGTVLGNAQYAQKEAVHRFHDGISWLMHICLFLTLGLLVFPSHLWSVFFYGLCLSLFLIFVARPVSVFVALAPFRGQFSGREKIFISWVGLRGAAPIILATFPRVANLQQAEFMFNLVFFAVLFSMLVQGSTIPYAAKLLRLQARPS